MSQDEERVDGQELKPLEDEHGSDAWLDPAVRERARATEPQPEGQPTVRED